MKFIEFVTTTFEDKEQKNIIMVNIEEVSSFKKTSIDNIVELHLKNSEVHFICGNYKTLTNRYFYTLSKKTNIYEDDIIRPSIRVLHKNELLEVDGSFLDKEQLSGFIIALIDLCDIKKQERLESILKNMD